MKEKEEEIKINIVWLKRWAKRDGLYLIVILLSLSACVYTLDHVDEKIEECNQYWIEEYNKKFNEGIEYENKNIYQNSTWTGNWSGVKIPNVYNR